MDGIIRLIRKIVPWLWRLIEFINALILKICYARKMDRAGGAAEHQQLPEGILLKRLRIEDTSRCHGFLSSLEAEDTIFFAPFDFNQRTIHRILCGGSYLLFGAETDSRFIGLCFLRLFAGGRAYLGFVVGKESRGRGLGKAMVSALVLAARESSFDLYSSVSRANVPSWKAHMSNGFILVREMENDYALLRATQHGEAPKSAELRKEL